MMECTYVHVMSNMMNISAGKNMHFFDSNFKPLYQSKCCRDLIDNRAGAPIFVLGDKDREKKLSLRYALKEFFVGL